VLVGEAEVMHEGPDAEASELGLDRVVGGDWIAFGLGTVSPESFFSVVVRVLGHYGTWSNGKTWAVLCGRHGAGIRPWGWCRVWSLVPEQHGCS
jgi:hypothetical protein